MFKNKIALKLSLFFAITLLIFSVIIGGVFMYLFKNHTVNMHKDELSKRAGSISTTLESYFEEGHSNGSMKGYGAYIRFIGDIAGSDVWVVDENANIITAGTNEKSIENNYVYSDLPKDAENLIKEVFYDKTAFSENFSLILNEPTLTVGVPIKTSNNRIVGAVLLHSPIFGTDEAIKQGLILLVTSIFIALIISFTLSAVFSVHFTRPLSKMKNTALKLAQGDYSQKNNISQNDEIGQLARIIDVLSVRLEKASKESEKLEQMRKDFIANISHELRTPVTVMSSSLEALADQVITEPDKIREYHIQMLIEAKFLQRLIGDLLDLSRLQNAEFAIEKTEVSLCNVIEDSIRSARQIAKEKSINIKTVCSLSDEEKISYKIMGDYSRLRQMLLIILDNAIKFSFDNSTVEIGFDKNEIFIRDFGVGIDEKDLPYIFNRFYKSRCELNKSGTGLGLAIAKKIANRHNISLRVESNKSIGTTFIFSI